MRNGKDMKYNRLHSLKLFDFPLFPFYRNFKSIRLLLNLAVANASLNLNLWIVSNISSSLNVFFSFINVLNYSNNNSLSHFSKYSLNALNQTSELFSKRLSFPHSGKKKKIIFDHFLSLPRSQTTIFKKINNIKGLLIFQIIVSLINEIHFFNFFLSYDL